MSSITEEIQQLQLRILELEKDKDNKTVIDHNFKVINDVLNETKTSLECGYSTTFRDKQLVTYLEAISNILQIMDKKLKKLEHEMCP